MVDALRAFIAIRSKWRAARAHRNWSLVHWSLVILEDFESKQKARSLLLAVEVFQRQLGLALCHGLRPNGDTAHRAVDLRELAGDAGGVHVLPRLVELDGAGGGAVPR